MLIIIKWLLQVPDSASTSYKVGYYIGSWLPFVVLVLLAFIVIWIIGRKRRK
jgi:hypothetical protein